MKISDMKNLGTVNEEKLNAIGIKSAEELRATGTEKAYVLVKHLVDDGACLHLLYAMEAAIQDIPKKELTSQQREALKALYQRSKE